MAYIRHRDRMVQQSVTNDLRDTLIACRWMPGSTTRPVYSPFDPAERATQTTAVGDILPLLRGQPVNLIDYFPETDASGGAERTTPVNTLAIDTGRPQEPVPRELGSKAKEQQYLFALAFYAASDAVAMAVLNDLKDRYEGRIVEGDCIHLFNYNVDPTTTQVRMEVDGFRYARDVETVAPHEVYLYFAELAVTDLVD